MRVDFSCVTSDHVTDACRLVIDNGVPVRRNARSRFLAFEGQHLPAKYGLGLAYKLATGRGLGANDYTGGLASGSVLERLGFQVLRSEPGRRPNGSRLRGPRGLTVTRNTGALSIATVCVAGR